MGANSYAVTNLLSGLAAGAFVWSSGTNDTTRTRLNDGHMDARYINGAGTTGLVLHVDMGAATAVSGFALLNHNGVISASDFAVKVEWSSDDAAWTVAKAATTLNGTAPKNKDHVLQFASASKRYWRLTFTFTGTISLAIGEVFAFAAQVQLSRKGVYGGGERPIIKTSAVDFYTGGQQAYFLGGPVRVKRNSYVDLSPSERGELLTMWTAVQGNAKPFLWIESYEATSSAAVAAEQEVVYGRLSGMEELDLAETDYQLYTSTEFIIRSLAREVGS